APEGIVLSPEPRNPVRLSRRGLMLAVGIIAVVIGGCFYGIYGRIQESNRIVAAVEEQQVVAPAKPDDVISAIPPATAQPVPVAMEMPPETAPDPIAQAQPTVYIPPPLPPLPDPQPYVTPAPVEPPKPTPEEIA